MFCFALMVTCAVNEYNLLKRCVRAQRKMQDEHRLFVQVMMSRRILTKEEAKAIVEEKLSNTSS